MTLIFATLSPSALLCIIGCKSSKEMWMNLGEQFSSVTRTSIVQLKIDLQNIKKGQESVGAYLHRIKESKDQLDAAGVTIFYEDIVIVALRGLPNEYNTIKAVIHGRENLVSLKELRYQLKTEETTLDETTKQIPLMFAMFTQASGFGFDHGGFSGPKFASPMPQGFASPLNNSLPFMSLSPMSFPGFQQVLQGFHQLPILYMTNVHMAFATQLGSGSYNNLRGNNYKGKGKGKKFYGNNFGGQHNGSNTQFYP